MTPYEESLQFFYNRGFVLFDDLPEERQQTAKTEVTRIEYEAHVKYVGEAREGFLANMHRAINDPYHIQRIINGMAAINKIRTLGDDYLLKFIRSNVIWFNKDGTEGDIYGKNKS